MPETFREKEPALENTDFKEPLPESAQREIERTAELPDEEFVGEVRPVLRGLLKEIRKTEGELVRADEVVYHMLPSPNNPDRENPLVVMPSRGCGYEKGSGGCSMCNFGCEGRETTMEDADTALEIIFDHNRRWFAEHPEDDGGVIVNINEPGSFLSDRELSPEVRDHIYRRIREYKETEAQGRTVVMVTESRLDQITEEKLIEMREKLGPGVVIDIGVGIESTDLVVEEGIFNKGKPDDWQEKMRMMDRHGVGVTPHLMFGAPFLTEEQAINDAAKSLRDCLEIRNDRGEKFVNTALLMIMNRRPGTMVDYLARNEQHQMPNVMAVAETMERLGEELSPEDFRKIMVFGLVGPKNLVEAGTEYMTCHDESCQCNGVFGILREWRGTPENLKRLKDARASVTDACPNEASFQGPYKRQDGLSPEDKRQIKERAVGAYYRMSQTILPEKRGMGVEEIIKSFE